MCGHGFIVLDSHLLFQMAVAVMMICIHDSVLFAIAMLRVKNAHHVPG